jgi:hypothetical protein
MKTFKSGQGLAKWVLRLAVLGIVYVTFVPVINMLNFSSLSFYVAAAFGIFSVLLFAGGFSSKNNLTALSGFAILLLSILEIFLFSNTFGKGLVISTFSVYFPLAAIGLLFWTNGNKI